MGIYKGRDSNSISRTNLDLTWQMFGWFGSENRQGSICGLVDFFLVYGYAYGSNEKN